LRDLISEDFIESIICSSPKISLCLKHFVQLWRIATDNSTRYSIRYLKNAAGRNEFSEHAISRSTKRNLNGDKAVNIEVLNSFSRSPMTLKISFPSFESRENWIRKLNQITERG